MGSQKYFMPQSTGPQHLTKAYIHGIKMTLLGFGFILSLYFLFYRNALTFARCPPQNSKSIFLPYADPFDSATVPMINTSIDNIHFRMPMDTGSTGLAIGAPLLPHVDTKNAPAAWEYLSSSGVLYNGHLVPLDVTFHGLHGSSATSTVPVLVVNTSVTCKWYDAKTGTGVCPPNPEDPTEKPTPRDTRKITYMGVGFGRNELGDGQPNAIPSANPFLNVRSIDGVQVDSESLRTGYIVSTLGVELGITEANTAGFVFTQLGPGVTHSTDPRDWAMVNMSARANEDGYTRGSGLVDTGIEQMYWRGIATPNFRDPNLKTSCKVRPMNGTTLSISFPDADHAIAGYSFVVGEKGPMVPLYVCPEIDRHPPFVNTGRNFLLGYSIAFDAVDGKFGFKKLS